MAVQKRKTLIVIAGPTAVGKTAISIRLAKHYQADIISADSRQVFKELTIGTAKPSSDELTQVNHHFIDSHSINEKFDAAQFGTEALKVIDRLFLRHDHVIVCGGSGLYIKALLEGFDDIPEVAPELRHKLITEYHHHGLEWLQQQMRDKDPEHYLNIDQKNPHRLIRALEVKIGTGFSISHFRQRQKKIHPFSIVKIGLELPREILYERINKRMDEMIGRGLFDEAKSLVNYREHNALQTVGYQEIFGYLQGQYDYNEAVRLLKQNTRRYAKRQLTWFKKDDEMQWFHPDQFNEMIAFIEQSKFES